MSPCNNAEEILASSTITIPLYGQEVICVGSLPDLTTMFNHFGVDHSDCTIGSHGYSICLEHPQQGYVVIVAVFSKHTDIIVHEAFHACMFIHQNLGLTIDHDNQETMAYMIGYLARAMIDKLLNTTIGTF